MDRIKNFADIVFNNGTELIRSVLECKNNFNVIYESETRVMFEDAWMRTVHLTTSEMVLRHRNTSLYYKDNIIQFCTSESSYVSDVIYIPSFHNYSFYRMSTDDDLFQLSTVVDLKYITLDDIHTLNKLRDYFEYRYLKNNI